jgi:uncharacterized protein YxeA
MKNITMIGVVLGSLFLVVCFYHQDQLDKTEVQVQKTEVQVQKDLYSEQLERLERLETAYNELSMKAHQLKH